MRTVQDYTNLITSWLSTKPRLVATVALDTAPYALLQEVLNGMIEDFNLDTATGEQLDIIGLWIGVGRNLDIPITDLYFSFDIVGLGFDEGIWKGPYDPDTGITTLPDDAYRVVLYAKIASNMWDGTMEGIITSLDLFYQRTGVQITVKDNLNMTMTVGWDNTSAPFTPILSALVRDGYLPPRPMGVEVLYEGVLLV